MYNIKIYEEKNGKSEIKEYIKSLRRSNSKSSKIKFNKVISYIRMLKIHGLELGIPYMKHLADNIWELRPLRDRILLAYLESKEFILLTVFMKKTQKTPKREIEKAKRLLKDYIDRSEDNE